jgi:hypothetical protein
MWRACSTHWRDENAGKVLMRTSEFERSVGKSRHRLKHNIKTHLKELGWEDADLINLAQNKDSWRIVKTAVIRHTYVGMASSVVPIVLFFITRYAERV